MLYKLVDMFAGLIIVTRYASQKHLSDLVCYKQAKNGRHCMRIIQERRRRVVVKWGGGQEVGGV